MSITQTITKTWQGQSGTPISKSVSYSANEELNLDFPLNANTSNLQMPLAFNSTLLKSIYVYSDQTVTLKTNSSGSPQETLTITSGDPLQWDENCGLDNPFANNVNTSFWSNAGTSAANVSVRTLTNG